MRTSYTLKRKDLEEQKANVVIMYSTYKSNVLYTLLPTPSPNIVQYLYLYSPIWKISGEKGGL
jgi:hypothetical protein